MKKYTNEEKISLIKKYYKKDSIFLELILDNYEGYSLYIILNNIKKTNTYKLSWFDLSVIEDNNIKRYISCEYIQPNSIELLKAIYARLVVDSNYSEDVKTDSNIVTLYANVKTEVNDSISITFEKYLPKKLSQLTNILVFVFNNMPRQYENLLFEMTAKIMDATQKYEYKKEFSFDLFNGNIDELFSYQIIKRGQEYYENSKIEFLEEIDGIYFAIVDGMYEYVTIIKYEEKEKIMQVYCSCPCEFYCKHVYAVILAIRNKKFRRFYKIMYNDQSEDLLERLTELDYYLCLRAREKFFEIINDQGEIEAVPMLDKDNNFIWTILEDSEDERLKRDIEYFLSDKC